MNQFDLDTLRTIMRSSAGVPEDVDLGGRIDEVPFIDLGYDSLAMLEIISQVRRQYRVEISDDALFEMSTPSAAVAYVNRRLTEARS
jgi:act minimal PKS acyl carrier protein